MSVDENDLTVGQLMAMLEKYGAGFISLVPKDANDQPMGAVIVVDKESAVEVLVVLDELQRKWDEQS